MNIKKITAPFTNVLKPQAKQPVTPVIKIEIPQALLNAPIVDTFEKSSKPEEKKSSVLPEGKIFKKPSLATKDRPYCIFDEEKVKCFVDKKEEAIPELKEMFKNAQSEEDICESLFIADKMIDAGTKGMDKLYYGSYSKFNEEKSPNVQSFLSGVYRKILVPDAFGPLIKMLANNIKEPQKDAPFDPNEAIGGAILEHIKAPKINPL